MAFDNFRKSEKAEKLKMKKIQKRLQKLFVEVLRGVGFVFMSAFAVTGAIFYYTNTQPQINIVSNLMVSIVVIAFLWLMLFVKEGDEE